MGKLPPNSNTASQPFNGNREQRLLCISLSGENLYKIEIFWPLLFFHLSTHAQTIHSPLPKRMHLKSAAQTHWKPVFHRGGDGLWGCSHKGKILWTNSDRNWRSPRCPTLYTRHTLTTHQNKILSLEESFLVKDFCSPGSLWSGIFFTAVQVQYSNIPSFFWPWYTPCFLVSSTTSSTAKTAALQLFASYNLLYKRAAPWHSIRWVCLGKNVRTGQGTHPTQTGHVLKFVFCVCVFLCFYFSLLFFFLIFKWRRITKY